MEVQTSWGVTDRKHVETNGKQYRLNGVTIDETVDLVLCFIPFHRGFYDVVTDLFSVYKEIKYDGLIITVPSSGPAPQFVWQITFETPGTLDTFGRGQAVHSTGFKGDFQDLDSFDLVVNTDNIKTGAVWSALDKMANLLDAYVKHSRIDTYHI